MMRIVIIAGAGLVQSTSPSVREAEDFLRHAEALQGERAPVVLIRAAALDAAQASPSTHRRSALLLVAQTSATSTQQAWIANYVGDAPIGGLLPKSGRPSLLATASAHAVAARALGDLAAGRRGAARRKLSQPGVEAALRAVDSLLPGGVKAVHADAAMGERQPRAQDPWLAARGALLGWGDQWESEQTLSLRVEVDWVPVVGPPRGFEVND